MSLFLCTTLLLSQPDLTRWTLVRIFSPLRTLITTFCQIFGSQLKHDTSPFNDEIFSLSLDFHQSGVGIMNMQTLKNVIIFELWEIWSAVSSRHSYLTSVIASHRFSHDYDIVWGPTFALLLGTTSWMPPWTCFLECQSAWMLLVLLSSCHGPWWWAGLDNDPWGQ